MISKKEEYWRDRAAEYSGFKWANDEGYLLAFIAACDLKQEDRVLDLGCGPGIVAREVAKTVDCIVGLDNSKDMLLECDGSYNLLLADAGANPFPDFSFDKVLARNIFHHMTENLLQGARESYRVLKTGGHIIVGERIPPSANLLGEWRSMLALKDERICFTAQELFRLLDAVGFKVLHSFPFWNRRISVRTWLGKTGLPIRTQADIFERHVSGTQAFREGLNMTISHGDCTIDIKNIIMVAERR